MAGINKVILVGHLGADPELKYTPSGQAVVKFNIATSESWNDKSGQKQERTEWHRIVAWAKLAEICGKHLSKGRQVYVEGRIQSRQWEDQQGQKRTTTEIIANTVQFLGAANQAASSQTQERDTMPEMNSNFSPEPQFGTGDEIPF